jgi:hypothetical protein
MLFFKLYQDLFKASQDGEIAATRTPGNRGIGF